MAKERDGEPGLEIVVSDEPRVVLYAERLRDGRVALGTRREGERGWEAGELHLLEPYDWFEQRLPEPWRSRTRITPPARRGPAPD